jgi:DNA-binding winged helix-turn-helix (wHTH) protein/serine/threonine protein kinase
MTDPSFRAGSATRRLWSFGRCTFDESSWTLQIDGQAAEIEAKPLEILLQLLSHAGEVVTKEELLDAVWSGVTVVEASLTTAVSKLRKAMGDQQSLIVTVPRIGYRLTGFVSVNQIRATVKALPFSVGMQVPDRPNWQFAERLDLSVRGEVWRIEHTTTGENRVLKYATDADRLRSLKRELALWRLLNHALGARPDVVPVIDWNLSDRPFFIESAYGGPDMGAWAASQGGLTAVPIDVRVDLAAQMATTVAAAHGLGILHKDIKPANVLVAPDRTHGWQVRIVDFGSAALLDPDRLDLLGITTSGFDPNDTASSVGTSLWMAPELLGGGAPSTASDIFSLGVLLYQLVVGDLHKPLAPGWEASVTDPLLREDIAAAVAGDPGERLIGAAELAQRLRSLEARRAARQAADRDAARIIAVEARLARVRARRPWVIAAVAALLLGVVTTSILYLLASTARDDARHQTAIAETINRFLANDLLARSSPFRSETADERLVDAVKHSALLIDRRFAGEPAIAARLHQTIANALDKRSDWSGARGEYERAIKLWTQAENASAPDVLATQLQLAMMEARSYEQGSLPRAKALLAGAQTAIGKTPPRADVAVWLASARGMVALVDNDARGAEAAFAQAADGADRLPEFDTAARLTFRQRQAFAKIRLGDGAAAERLFRLLGHDFRALEGPDGPDVLMVGMNLAQALMIAGKHAEAIDQANAVYPRMLARLGPDHEMLLQLLTTRAQSEGVLERWNDAIRDDLHVHDIAMRKQGPKSFFAIATLTDAATAQCRGGHLAEGLANARMAHDMAAAAFGKAALTDATSYTLAACEIDARDYGTATRHLEGIDRTSVAQLAGDPNWGANVDLALAQVAVAKGQMEDARRSLDTAAPAFKAPGAEPYQTRLWRELDRLVAGSGKSS